jgi:hypothetical protein
MRGMGRIGSRVAIGLLACAALGMATTSSPVPGTLNYVEGQVSLDGRALSAKSVSSTDVGPRQVLETGQGNAEILLTPGVFLRLGHNGAIRMLSPGLADTTVALEKGSAILEVDQLFKENHLDVVLNGATATIEKTGLYQFDANPPSVSVLTGKAAVNAGSSHVTVKKGRQVFLTGAESFIARKFDKNAIESEPLYRWSKLRSDYDSQANLDEARMVYTYGGWYGPGWYWDPFWSSYAFLPGSGFLYSPFGWGFYSPIAVGPFFGFGGFHHGGFHHEGGFHHGGFRHGAFNHDGGVRHEGGFHAGGFHGGGFHGGGRRG